MKAALALVFLACIAGSMASDARNQFIDQLVQQGHLVAQTVLSQLQQQILGFVQQAVGQLSALVGSFGGRFDFNFNTILDQIKPIVTGLINQALVQVLAGLQGIIGGMY
jgi:phage-related protein